MAFKESATGRDVVVNAPGHCNHAELEGFTIYHCGKQRVGWYVWDYGYVYPTVSQKCAEHIEVDRRDLMGTPLTVVYTTDELDRRNPLGTPRK